MYHARHTGKRSRHTKDDSGRKRIVSSGSRILSTSNQELNNNNNKEADDEDDELMVLSKEDFEKTIKLATNNKITNSNTWDLKLIEYFYDMNHLKSDDGVSINFQTASATLDGCTKVISKRVDSVAVDTDALIQILAIDNNSSNTKKKTKHSNDSDDDDSDNDDSNDKDYIDENNKKKKRNSNITNLDDDNGDQFLVSWSKLKPTDSQFQFVTIDPVFRKMISDFDEGGAKSLLLNNLKITFDGRISFNDTNNNGNAKSLINSEDQPKNPSLIKNNSDKMDDTEEDNKILDSTVNYASKTDELETNTLLNSFKFLVDNSDFESLTICNEIKDVKNSVEDIEYGKKFIDKMNEQIQREEPKTELPDFNVEYDYDIDNFDLNDNIGNENTFNLSEITELDKTSTANHTYAHTEDGNNMEDESMLDYEEIMKKESLLFAELDKRSNINKIRRQHWKIRAINSNVGIISRPNSKDLIFKSVEEDDMGDGELNDKNVVNVNKKKNGNSNSDVISPKKKEYVIDFMSDSSSTDTSTLFQKSKRALRSINPNTINSELTTIPDLKVWNSERLVSSFLKPKRRFRNIFTGRSKSSKPVINADRDFWAAKYNDKNVMPNDDIDEDVADFLYDVMDRPAIEEAALNVTQSINHSNDDFVADDFEAGDYDFDAPIIDQKNEVNLVKTPKSSWHRDSIHYEKRSKKINVRLLKQNLWDVTKRQVEVIEDKETPQQRSEHKPIDLKLSNIVKDTYSKYEGREKSDLSTSFFFICMLHIANEEGLTIERTDDLNDLIIHAKS